MTRRAPLALALALVTVAGAGDAGAHDLWIEAKADRAGTLAGRLVVGEAPIADEEKAFEREKFSRLVVVTTNGSVDLLPRGRPLARPAIALDGLGEGDFLVVADRAPVGIELPAAKFDAYLAEEGLGRIVEERARRGEAKKPGRERYTRHMKGLVHVGDSRGVAAVARGAVGQRLEIVVDAPSSPLRGSDRVTARVLFDGAPLVGAKVTMSSRVMAPGAIAATKQEAHVTDAGGAVGFTVVGPGLVVVHLVHMRRCVAAGGGPCADADWESFWGSWATFATGS